MVSFQETGVSGGWTVADEISLYGCFILAATRRGGLSVKPTFGDLGAGNANISEKECKISLIINHVM